MARIGVAATAPFGSDVLERLAARREIAFCLTRPDRPAGRGRRIVAPRAKVAALRLGIPVLQPERLDASVELPAEQIGRNDHAVRAGNDVLGGQLDAVIETLGLEDGDAETHRSDLCGRCRDSASTAGRPVRSGEAERDLAAGREPCENVGAERCGRSHTDSSHVSA